jgi:CRISPR system Cascade subunit CasD
MNTLFIRLEGPLQSWGLHARWTDRDTALEPTKSGVVGLLAAALGWGRDRDTAIRELGDSVQFGVRVDLPGRVIRDYHTIVGGVLSAEGKVKINASTKLPETVVSPRFYLSDASFLAALVGQPDRIALLAAALHSPHWPLFLGRKSCPPAAPLLAGTGQFDTPAAALSAWPRSPRSPSGPLRAVIEASPGDGVPRPDQVDRLSRRSYRPRFIKDIPVDPPLSGEE